MLSWFTFTWLSLCMEQLGPHEKETFLQGYMLSSVYILVLFSRHNN